MPEKIIVKDRSAPLSRNKDIQPITIHLPSRLAQRAEKYANENGNTVTGVVIEALDTFLRGQTVE